MSEPSARACVECLRRSWLLALLGPYIEKVATGSVGRRSPELLRLGNEDLVEVVAPNDGEAADRRRWRRCEEGWFAERLGGGRVLGDLPPRRPLSAGPRATPPTRPGR